MISKNKLVIIIMSSVILLTFIVPSRYMHITALAFLPFIVFLTNTKKQYLDKELTLLILFSLSYTLINMLHIGFTNLGAGQMLKYMLLPTLFYQTGKTFVEYSNNSKSFINNLLLILFAFSIITFISIAKDISLNGFVSTVRSIAIIGEGDKLKNATNINAMLSVWTVMIGFIFYKSKDFSEKKQKIIMIIISIIAIAGVLRLGSRTGLVLSGVSITAIIFYNFPKYKISRKVEIIFLILLFLIVIQNYILTNEDLFAAYQDRVNTNEHGASSAGGRTILWAYYGSNIFDYPFGDVPPIIGQPKFAHNLYLDIARVSGIIPLFLYLFFTFYALKNLKKLLLNKKISKFIKNIILVLNIAFYLTFIVEPILSGYFSFFLLYLFISGTTTMLNKSAT